MSVSMYVLYNKSGVFLKLYRCTDIYILVVLFSVLPNVLDRSHFSGRMHCISFVYLFVTISCYDRSTIACKINSLVNPFMCIVHVNMMQN